MSIGGECRLQLLQCAVRLGRNQREDAVGLRFDRPRTSIPTLIWGILSQACLIGREVFVGVELFLGAALGGAKPTDRALHIAP